MTSSLADVTVSFVILPILVTGHWPLTTAFGYFRVSRDPHFISF
jgi:hypothetical protein